MTDPSPLKGPSLRIVPEGDVHERLVCADCNYIVYDNPKVVTAVVASFEGKILLVRRDIEPRKGFWSLPGGFMEKGETVAEGAARETAEEAGASVVTGPLLAVYMPPDKTKVLMIYRAELSSPDLDPGRESQEVALFDWQDIPWDALAFPMVEKSLRMWERTRDLTDFQPEHLVLPPMPAAKPAGGRKPKTPGM